MESKVAVELLVKSVYVSLEHWHPDLSIKTCQIEVDEEHDYRKIQKLYNGYGLKHRLGIIILRFVLFIRNTLLD